MSLPNQKKHTTRSKAKAALHQDDPSQQRGTPSPPQVMDLSEGGDEETKGDHIPSTSSVVPPNTTTPVIRTFHDEQIYQRSLREQDEKAKADSGETNNSPPEKVNDQFDSNEQAKLPPKKKLFWDSLAPQQRNREYPVVYDSEDSESEYDSDDNKYHSEFDQFMLAEDKHLTLLEEENRTIVQEFYTHLQLLPAVLKYREQSKLDPVERLFGMVANSMENTDYSWYHHAAKGTDQQHGDQGRVAMGFKESAPNIFQGASLERTANIIDLLIYQKVFFSSRDCCVQKDLVQVAKLALSQALSWMQIIYPYRENRKELTRLLKGWVSLGEHDQQIIFPLDDRLPSYEDRTVNLSNESKTRSLQRQLDNANAQIQAVEDARAKAQAHIQELEETTALALQQNIEDAQTIARKEQDWSDQLSTEQQQHSNSSSNDVPVKFMQQHKQLLDQQKEQAVLNQKILDELKFLRTNRQVLGANVPSPILNQGDHSMVMDDSILGQAGLNHPNFLLQPETIPNWDQYTPQSESGKRLLKYVRNCLNKNQNLSIAQWPVNLKGHVSSQYLMFRTTTANKDQQDKYPVDWTQLSTHQLLEWLTTMEDLTGKGEKNEPVEYFFTQWIVAKKPTIDWSIRGNAHTHPFSTFCANILNEYERVVKDLNEPVTAAQQIMMVKGWKRFLLHQNVSPEAINQIKGKLEPIFLQCATLREAVEATMLFVSQKMTELQSTENFYLKKDPSFTKVAKKDKWSAGQRWDPYAQQKNTGKRKYPGHLGVNFESKSTTSSNQYPKGQSKNKQFKAGARCKMCGWNKSFNPDTNKALPCKRETPCHMDPRRNKTDQEWDYSPVGKKWKELNYGRGLPKDESITLDNAEARRNQKINGKTMSLNKLGDELSLTQELIPFVVNAQKPLRPNAIKQRIKQTSSILDPILTGELLLDTGALGNSVISQSFYDKLKMSNTELVEENIQQHLVCASNDKQLISKRIKFFIHVSVEGEQQTPLVIQIVAIVANINVDLIIDRETIKKFHLLYYFPSHFVEGSLLRLISTLPTSLLEETEQLLQFSEENKKRARKQARRDIKTNMVKETWLNHFTTEANNSKTKFKILQKKLVKEKLDALKISHDRFAKALQLKQSLAMDELDFDPSDGFTDTAADDRYDHYLAHLDTNFSKKPAFEREGNLTDIPDNKLESIPAELLSDIADEADYTKIDIGGSHLERQRLWNEIHEERKLFKSTVQSNPADLTPFLLEVDECEWHTSKNTQYARHMDIERSTAMLSMLQILMDHGIISPCPDAGHYSHAFLVPKPNGKWRLVLDFKNLNKATTNTYKWPLPNIRDMLHRVGESKPCYFAIFDLTSGYYQAPITANARKYTAFITKHGIYQWNRLPMGLTGACSYFQHSLAMEVLQGLIHLGVELYLDDCLVHAQTFDEFIDRLRSVFRRFREKGITLNPAKCRIGLKSVEFVGHTIDKDGLHFTRSKLDSVLQFPRPTTKRQVKSFLGLANYFRDHIKNHSIRVELLQSMVNNYDTRQAKHLIKWDEASNEAFLDIRQAIDECPKLWFLDHYSPIYLQTDASDYGIGAYLYQRVTQDDGSIVEHPVNFISKSIASGHTNWDTPMKEGYAIFYALKKWEYLLRDRQFTILTDHINLTKLRTDKYETNKMVRRWFMCFQEYDIIEWGYKPGPENEIPDSLSRLCPAELSEHPAVHLYQLTGMEVPPEHWDIIARYHGNDGPDPKGHGGEHRTVDLLIRENHIWTNMRAHVRNFIKLCPCCQKMDQMKKVIHSYPFTSSSYGLWNTVSVDFIERLQEDDYGCHSVVVIVDNFSRFIDLYPVKAINAETACDALLQFSGRFGTPLRFCTDSGSSFDNEMIKALTERLGVEHTLTAAYSKEQNGIVERQNKEVLRHLRNILFDKRLHNKWSKCLPLVQRIINNSVNSSTGLTPAEVVFPNGIVMDRDLLREAHPMYMSSYIRELQEAQGLVIALCEQNLRAKDTEHLGNYSQERTVFENGSYVLVEHRHNALRRGPRSKLLPFLRGPLLVKGHDLKGMYNLQDLISQNILKFHVSKLRHFHYDQNTLQPLEAAVTDIPDEFVVQSCLDMKGNPRGKKAQLSFKVRWAGYGPEDDTWEPWSCVRDNAQVLLWISQHPSARVRNLLPKDYNPTQQEDQLSQND